MKSLMTLGSYMNIGPYIETSGVKEDNIDKLYPKSNW